jgi:O-antigen ligase
MLYLRLEMTNVHDAGRLQSIALAVLLSAGGCMALIVSNDARAPLIFAGGLCAAAAGYFLLQRPLTALYLALFLHLAPKTFRIEGVYELIVHSTTALALTSCVIQAVISGRRITWNAISVVTGLYLVWGTTSLLWADDIVDGRKKLVSYAIGLTLIFLISNQIRSLKALDGLMRVLRIVGWILVFGGIYAILFEGYQSGTRLKVLGENENALGIIMIVMLPGFIWSVIRSREDRYHIKMILSVVYILSSMALVALSGSRGSALSFVIVLLTLLLSRHTRTWGKVGVVLVIGALVGAPFLLEGLSKRVMENEGGTLGGREELWQASGRLIYDYPLTGAGVGNGQDKIPQYIREISNDPYKLMRLQYPSHNPVLEATTDTGLPGMLIYLSLCLSALWQFVKSRRFPVMREGALASYFPIMLAVTCGFTASWIKAGGLEANPIFFIVLALLVVPIQLRRNEG